MNKRIFYLLMLLFVAITLIDIKLYLNNKKNALNEYNYFIDLKTKIKKVFALEKKYKFNYLLFNRLKNFCNITQNDEKYILICKNLDMNKFNTIQNILFKNNFKIISFEIDKNKKASIKAEINK